MILFTATSTFFELIVYWEKKVVGEERRERREGEREGEEVGREGGRGGRERGRERRKGEK